jgi:kynurenine formamidase
MKQVFDLSQPVQNGMSYYPGDPEPVLQPAGEAAFPWHVTRLAIGSHTGTHIDAASHFFPQGRTIDQYPLERFLPQGIVIPLPDLGDDAEILPHFFDPFLDPLPKGGAVLIRTGWDRYWKQGRYNHHPFLTQEAARRLVEAGANLVGIDALNVDSTQAETDHAHQIFLGSDVLIVENLANLNQLSPWNPYQMSFLPLYLAGVDGSPVRAAAWEVD